MIKKAKKQNPKRESMGPGVKASAKESIEKLETWKKPILKGNRDFKYTIRLPENKRPALERLFNELTNDQNIYKIEQKKDDLDVLLANLIVRSGKWYVSIPLSRNHWKSRYHDSSYYIIDLVHKLEDNGLIKIFKGEHWDKVKNPDKISFNTRIRQTKKLYQQFKPIPDYMQIIESKELVELRTKIKYDESGNPIKKGKSIRIEYKDMDYSVNIRTYIRHIRKSLKKLNQVNKKAEIKLINKKKVIRVSTELKAIFSDKFNRGGRLYASGPYVFQHLSGKKRLQLLIKGDGVVELDYSGLHPRLLYAKEGIQFDDDPYLKVHPNKKARPFLKVMLLAMVNSEDFVEAEKACNEWFAEYKIKNNEDLRKREDVKSLGINRARPLMEAFLEKHEPIERYLCNGKKIGFELMNLDSKIALDVCSHFSQKEIPILPVHDSFIVQEQ